MLSRKEYADLLDDLRNEWLAADEEIADLYNRIAELETVKREASRKINDLENERNRQRWSR